MRKTYRPTLKVLRMSRQSTVHHDLISGNITADVHVWHSTENYELMLYYKGYVIYAPTMGIRAHGSALYDVRMFTCLMISVDFGFIMLQLTVNSNVWVAQTNQKTRYRQECLNCIGLTQGTMCMCLNYDPGFAPHAGQ